ncbi:hypothetical protein BVX93_02100 [bacterium B13(2017)]|nr:hypothetical protein BVX93_02100 [bacterium B13(2017)]
MIRDFADRRRHRRFSYQCRSRNKKTTDVDWFEGYIKNISFRGISFESNINYSIKDELVIELYDYELLDDNMVIFHIEVMWSKCISSEDKKYNIGAKFKRYDSEFQDMLFLIISECMKREKAKIRKQIAV